MKFRNASGITCEVLIELEGKYIWMNR